MTIKIYKYKNIEMLRVPRCETPVTLDPIIVDDPDEEEDKPGGGRGGGWGGARWGWGGGEGKGGGKLRDNHPQEDPPENYEPDKAEDTASAEFDYYSLLLVPFALIGAATGAYFVFRWLKSKPPKYKKLSTPNHQK